MQHSVPLRTRSGSHAHAGWRDFIISTVDLMMPAELEALLGRSERPRSCTLMGARGPSTSSCTHNSDPGPVPLPGFGLGDGGQHPTGSPGLTTTSRRSQRCAAAAREPSPLRPHTVCPGARAIALTAACARCRPRSRRLERRSDPARSRPAYACAAPAAEPSPPQWRPHASRLSGVSLAGS